MNRIYGLLQILSIDVVLGALASGSLVVYILNVQMPVMWWVALPVSVWVMYTADHLLDAYRLGEQAHTTRHLFHHYHFRWISGVWVFLVGVCVVLVPWFLPLKIRLFGVGMGILVLLHLGLVKLIGDRVSWFFHKELGVALIYTAGVWGGPVLQNDSIKLETWGFFCLQFMVLALINLLLFSMYEREVDEKDGHTSFVRAIGVKNTRLLIGGLAFIWVIMGFLAGIGNENMVSWIQVESIFLLMGIILVWISWGNERFFRIEERYRSLGDAVFYLPVLIWFW